MTIREVTIREVTMYQVVCDHCGGTADDMGAGFSFSDDADDVSERWADAVGIAVGGRHACHNPECGIAVLDSHPDLAARSSANGVRRWWVVLDQRWGDYAAFYAYRGGPIPDQSSRSLADVMDEAIRAAARDAGRAKP